MPELDCSGEKFLLLVGTVYIMVIGSVYMKGKKAHETFT